MLFHCGKARVDKSEVSRFGPSQTHTVGFVICAGALRVLNKLYSTKSNIRGRFDRGSPTEESILDVNPL